MNIQELKLKSSEQLIAQAEELGIENASTLRKQGNSFCYSKKSCRKRRNNRRWCSSAFTRRIWFFKSDGIKLSSRT
jgi:transcription termination factor Rho